MPQGHGGNLYPTHGLGPVAQYMNIARTDDLFDRLVSFSSPGAGAALYAKAKFPADHKWNQMKFECGDISTQIIKTRLGRTIMVQWDETSPRPYSRHNLIHGHEGHAGGLSLPRGHRRPGQLPRLARRRRLQEALRPNTNTRSTNAWANSR